MPGRGNVGADQGHSPTTTGALRLRGRAPVSPCWAGTALGVIAARAGTTGSGKSTWVGAGHKPARARIQLTTALNPNDQFGRPRARHSTGACRTLAPCGEAATRLRPHADQVGAAQVGWRGGFNHTLSATSLRKLGQDSSRTLKINSLKKPKLKNAIKMLGLKKKSQINIGQLSTNRHHNEVKST